jgi:uncharacterized protein YgiM (DUF1202 family)
MSNYNYSQYSNNKKNKTAPAAKAEEVIETPVEVTVPEVKMEVEPAVVCEPVAETIKPVETKEELKTVVGAVANCTKLNVRSKPSLSANVVTVVNAGEKLTIDPAKSNRDWFYVTVDNGNQGYNGYCMKKFVSAKL